MPKIKLNDLDYGGSPTVEDADHLMVADTRNQTLSAQNIITNILGDMAQLEHNATASKAYAKGEYLVLGSYFYKATAAIAHGDTLVAGTNIEQTNVGAEVSVIASSLTNLASSMLRHESLSKTTNANGDARANSVKTSEAVAMFYVPNNNTYDGIYIPFVSSVNNGDWYIHVMTFDGAKKANQAIAGTIYYFPPSLVIP